MDRSLHNVTQSLAEFVVALRFEDLPSAVIVEAKKAILDTVGVALAGSREESTRVLRSAFGSMAAGGSASILGTGSRTLPTVAALINGHSAQALDFDDSQHNSITHMSAPVLASALAAAELCGRSGKELLTAYVGGFEIGCRLGRAARFSRHLSRQGAHGTGVLGHFGAVTAAGKLLKLDRSQMKQGFGIAASEASGLMRLFGTMCKPLHAGHAAQDGLMSSLLAKQGFTGPEDIFEGAKNIFAVYAGATDPQQLLENLGQHFEITDNTIKIFACTGWRNPVMEALMALADAHALAPRDVAHIEICAHREMTELPNYALPRTGLEAKFSAQYAAAVALADRAGGVAQFTDQRVADPALMDLCRRVTLVADASLEPYQIRARVKTADGRELAHFIAAQKGDPRNPLSVGDIRDKFNANAMSVLPMPQAERLGGLLENLESSTDISELTGLCSPG